MYRKTLTFDQKKAMLNFKSRLHNLNSSLSAADRRGRTLALEEIYGPRSFEDSGLSAEARELDSEIELFKKNTYIFKQLKNAGVKIKLDQSVKGFYDELRLNILARNLKEIYLTLSDVQSALFTSVIVAKDYDHVHPDIILKHREPFINWLTFVTNSTNLQLKEMNDKYKAEQKRLFAPYIDFLKKQNIRASYSLANNQLLSFAFENLFMALERCDSKILSSISAVHISADHSNGKIHYNPAYNQLNITPNIWAEDIYKYLLNFFNPPQEQKTPSKPGDTKTEAKTSPLLEKEAVRKHIEKYLGSNKCDPYQFFEASNNDELDQIKTKFRKWAMFFHPDKNKNDSAAGEIFIKINTMYKQIYKEKNKR